ncbi:MAG: class I SAM-dependent methyltransferase [Burkholderiales bacterium]
MTAAAPHVTPPGTTGNRSVEFFDRQFRTQPLAAALVLNPFEEIALPHLAGTVLDFGCGMGNLAFAAARRGCTVTALDASPAAIEHVRARAAALHLPVTAERTDLRDYRIAGDYDAIVSIGLLMFFDCAKALAVLDDLRAHVRPGGVCAVNVLVEGTTYVDMFDPAAHCLFAPSLLHDRFADWRLLHADVRDFPAPGNALKRFATVVARRPAAA